MILINKNFNILLESEKKLLNNKCNNFVLSEEPNIILNDTKNYYYRHFLNPKDFEIEPIIKKITEYIKNTISESRINLTSSWINKVNAESNKDDDFHIDFWDLTFLLYLNENFNGGDFEYINENKEKIKIKPKTNLSIITNNKLLHRVLPVTEGERFSLVLFFEINKKKEKTLI